jgi:hypothetical protein
MAIAQKLLISLSSGELGYEGNAHSRSHHMDKARTYRANYIEAKSLKGDQAPCVEWFMDSKIANLESKYRHELPNAGGYDEVVKLYQDLAHHQPQPLSGIVQKQAPYLYGAEVGQLEKLVYDRLTGRDVPPPLDFPDDWIVIEESLPSVSATFPDPEELLKLKDALEKFAESKKEFNLSEQEAKKGKKGTKEEKKALSEAVAKSRENLNAMKALVMAADIKYGENEKYVKRTIVSANASGIIRDASVTKATKSKGPPKKVVTATNAAPE